jgi:hypothetical protein
MGAKISIEDAALPPERKTLPERRPSAVCFSPERQIVEIPSCSDLTQLEFESVYMTMEEYSQIQEEIHNIVEQTTSPRPHHYHASETLRGLERELSQGRKETAASIVRTMVRFQEHKDPDKMAEYYGNFAIPSVYEAYSTALSDEEQVMRDADMMNSSSLVGVVDTQKKKGAPPSSFLKGHESLQ